MVRTKLEKFMPTYEEKTQLVSKEAQSSSWAILKPLFTLSATATMLYVLGFLATNAGLSVWGIYDPEPSRSSSILTGALLVIYFATAVIPTCFYKVVVRRRTRIPAFLSALIGVLLLISLYVLLMTAAVGWKEFLSSPLFLFYAIWLPSIASLFGILLSEFPTTYSAFERLPTFERTCRIIGIAVVLFVLLRCFAGIYIFVPASWGGGEPIQKEIWFSKDADQILKEMRVYTKLRGDLIVAPKIWLLYSRTDSMVFCDAKMCRNAFQIPKDWIKDQVWSITPAGATQP